MMEKRLKVMPTVVLFKSESDGPDKYVSILESDNYNVKSLNCISFQFKNLKQLEEKLQQEDEFEGIIFTSQRSVQGVSEAIKESSEIIDNWKSKCNFSVGESTYELAKKLLNLETKGKESGNAQSLAAFIIQEKLPETYTKQFLYPSGNLKQDDLENLLMESNIKLDCVELYDTIEHPTLKLSIEALKSEKIDFLVYFSPSGVKFSLPILLSNKIDLAATKIIALGPSTRKCLVENGQTCYKMCPKPSPQSLLETLQSSF